MKKLTELRPDEQTLEGLLQRDDPGKHYDIKEKIYESNCNEGVYRAHSIRDNRPHIMKITRENMETTMQNNLFLKSETLLSMRLNHEHIMKPKEVFYHDDKFVILMEEMDYGSLEKVIHKYWKQYSVEFVKYIIFKVALGVQDLHKEQILHRDLKADNVLCNS